MSARLGLAIGAREISAVAVEGGKLGWTGSARIEGSVTDALDRLFADGPPVKRPRVDVTLSPAWVQTKKLEGLPSVGSEKLLNDLLAHNQRAFFLWKGVPAVVTKIHVTHDGERWAAAYDDRVLDQITQFARSRGWKLHRVAPLVATIPASFPDREILWEDGHQRLLIEGDVLGPRRIEQTDVLNDAPFVPAILAERESGSRFVGAFAAAIAGSRIGFAWRPPRDPARQRLLTGAQVGVAAALVAAAAAFALVGPSFYAAKFSRDSKSSLQRDAKLQADFRSSEAELRRITQRINRIAAFGVDRGRVARILAELSQTVPESTAIVTFHVDSLEGSFTAIAPNVADVLSEIAGTEVIDAPRIVGSVTREIVAGAKLERAAFRFRRAKPRVHTSTAAGAVMSR